MNQSGGRGRRTVLLGEGINFMAKRIKCGIANFSRIHIKIVNSLVSGENCVELYSHTDTIVLGKECKYIYNWNCPVKVSGWNTKEERGFARKYQ